jgi:hypothetical protein
MSKIHNKKRNVGIVYELMLRHIASCLVEGKNSSAQSALDLLSKSFSSETELYKEFRLFNALANSTVTSSSVAAAILSEARSAARRTDFKKLNREKSELIKEINHKLVDDEFYYRKIPQYRSYATIQRLLNSWRAGDRSNLAEAVQLESQVVDHLLEEKQLEKDVQSHVSEDIDSLVVKILSEKFNKKYGETLNHEQKSLVRTYVFSIVSDGGEKITSLLESMRKRTLKEIKALESKTENKTIQEKIPEVVFKINELRCDSPDDDLISKYLTVSQLKQTLLEVENEQ